MIICITYITWYYIISDRGPVRGSQGESREERQGGGSRRHGAGESGDTYDVSKHVCVYIYIYIHTYIYTYTCNNDNNDNNNNDNSNDDNNNNDNNNKNK